MDIHNLIDHEDHGIQHLDRHFHCYFHNKMMILLMMLERSHANQMMGWAEKEKISLSDIHHHFLPFGIHRRYHQAFRWLELFLDHYPYVAPSKFKKAIQMIKLIYEAFGFKLEENKVPS